MQAEACTLGKRRRRLPPPPAPATHLKAGQENVGPECRFRYRTLYINRGATWWNCCLAPSWPAPPPLTRLTSSLFTSRCSSTNSGGCWWTSCSWSPFCRKFCCCSCSSLCCWRRRCGVSDSCCWWWWCWYWTSSRGWRWLSLTTSVPGCSASSLLFPCRSVGS